MSLPLPHRSLKRTISFAGHLSGLSVAPRFLQLSQISLLLCVELLLQLQKVEREHLE
jgi:hypothetical protein